MPLKKIEFIGTSKLIDENTIQTDITNILPQDKERLQKELENGILLCQHIIRKPSFSKTRSYGQLKLLFLIITEILIFLKEPTTEKNKIVILESLKRHLPHETVNIGGHEYELPVSISDKAGIDSIIFMQFINTVLDEWREQGCIFSIDVNEYWGKGLE